MEKVQEMEIFQTAVRDLEKRLTDNESEIQRLMTQLQEWSRKAHAHCPACGVRSMGPRAPKRIEFSDLPVPDAAIECLLEFDHPISPKILRLKMEERGYPKHKLGRYANRLHTAIWRLIESGRIRREEGDEIIAIK